MIAKNIMAKSSDKIQEVKELMAVVIAEIMLVIAAKIAVNPVVGSFIYELFPFLI